MTRDHDKLNEITEQIQSDMTAVASDAVKTSMTMQASVDEVDAELTTDVEFSDDMVARIGVAMGLEWVAQAIEEQFERNLDDYQRRTARGVDELAEDRKSCLYENVRMMAYIDRDRRDEMAETLREHGI